MNLFLFTFATVAKQFTTVHCSLSNDKPSLKVKICTNGSTIFKLN